MEKHKIVEQKQRRILAWLAAHPDLFQRQGKVLESWRYHAGRQLGPYYRLMFRDQGKQRTLYLGDCSAFASEVRQALDRLQAAPHQERATACRRAAARAALRQSKQEWEAELHKQGLFLKGYEVRGYRRSASPSDG